MGMLAAGAGAADGLRNYLIQQLHEKQLLDEERRTAESGRHNMAEEGIQNRTIDENAKLRGATQESLAAERKRVEENRVRDDTRASLDDVMPGARISTQTRDTAVKSGAALPERFNPVKFYDEDFVGPIQPNGPQRGDVGAYTLGDNPKAHVPGADTNQLHDFVDTNGMLGVKGKHIQAFVDPKTKKIYAQSGDDITGKVDPWVKPDPPDRVLIQTEDGYKRRTDAAAELAGGGKVPLATTAATRSMQEGAGMIRPHISELDTMAQELDKRGQFGPVMSKIRALAEKFGTAGDPGEDDKLAAAIGQAISDDPTLNTDRLVGKFASTLGLMASGAGRVHGGARGGGSSQMMNYMKSLLSANGSLSMFQGRLDGLDSYMKTYEAGPHGDTGAAAPAADDLYQQYLNRGSQPK